MLRFFEKMKIKIGRVKKPNVVTSAPEGVKQVKKTDYVKPNRLSQHFEGRKHFGDEKRQEIA